MKTKHLRLMQRAYVILFFCFMYLPIAYMVVFSFNQSKGYALFTGFTLKWYTSLLHNESILHALWVSLYLALFSAVIATVLGTAASLGIASMGRKSRLLVTNITYITTVNPEIITGISLMMLFVAYQRFASELDFLPGDEAGIKSVSLRISGENVYGFLKGERGIHRLIRISPFDSSGRRHTSFASVDVIPDAGDDIEIEIKESDLRVDIFCASGPGGQGVNTTYSAVRITHIPSGISVQCQNERSQHHNKDSAMRILRGRLYDLELSKRDAARQAEYAGKNAISFGSQIRTYTLQPYRLVKDHRNNCEIGDTDAVLDGRIDKLLRDYLLWQHTNRQQQQQ